MDSYPEEKLNRDNEASLRKIRKLLAMEELESSIRLTTGNGEPAGGIEKYSFSEKGSAARLLGLLPGKEGKNEMINLHMDEAVHLYDIRNRQYLGAGTDFTISIETAVPELFGLVPGTIDDIEVDAPSVLARGETLVLDLKMAGEGSVKLRSVIRIDVFDPKGAHIPYYSDNCEVSNGSGTQLFTTALNDVAGDWKIRLTEVISGVEKELTFRLTAER
jgi:hypothetical protein